MQAIADAEAAVTGPSRTICLATGTYVLPPGPANEIHQVHLMNGETLLGAGKGLTILRGAGPDAARTALWTESYFETVHLRGLTITNGFGLSGGGIINQGFLALTDCDVSSNGASQGGGIWSRPYADDEVACDLTLTRCDITGNVATTDAQTGRGGGIYNDGPLTVDNCNISGNSSDQGNNCFLDSDSQLTGTCPA